MWFLFLLLFLNSKFDYIVEIDSTFERYYDDGTSLRTEFKKIQILSEEANKKLTSLSISYTPYYNKADFQYVKIIRGKDTLNFDLSTILDVLAPPDLGGTIFWGQRNKIFELKDLRKGDILEYLVIKEGGNWQGPTGEKTEFKTPYPGFFNTIELFGGDVPIKKKVYVVEENPSKKIRFGIFNGSVSHRKVRNDGKVLYVFYKKGIKPTKFEPFSPSEYDLLPKLIVTNIPSWSLMSKMEFERAEPNIIPDEFIRNFSDSLCLGLSDDEKISKLFYFVADEIRYLGLIESEFEGYEPHKASITLSKRSGVCKDKAALLASLLRAQGFKAYYATTAVGIRMENIPADQTNHAVVAIEKDDGEYIYLDPTVGSGGKDFLPASEGGQGVLVSREEGDTLRFLPLSYPEDNKIVIRVWNKLSGDTTYIFYDFTFKGGFDQQYRRFGSYGKQALRNYFINLFKDLYWGEVVIDSLSFSDPRDYSEYFKVLVYGRVVNYLLSADNLSFYKPVTLQLLETFSPGHINFIPGGRRTDLVLRFPFGIEIREVLSGKSLINPLLMKEEKLGIYSISLQVRDLQNDGVCSQDDSLFKGSEVVAKVNFYKKAYSPQEVKAMERSILNLRRFKNYWLVLGGGK